jgi:hypothetical protein
LTTLTEQSLTNFNSNLTPTSYKLIAVKVKKKDTLVLEYIKFLPSVVHTRQLLEEMSKNLKNKDITLKMQLHNGSKLIKLLAEGS